MTANPNVLALDLSLTATGVCRPDGSLMTWRTDPKHGDRRLCFIADCLSVALERFPPISLRLVVIEDLLHSTKSAGATGQVHGVVKERILRLGLSLLLIPPATLKKYATGVGNSDKPTMRMELYKRAGLDVSDDNQVDAWWLRAAGLDLLGAPVVDLPAVNRGALDKYRTSFPSTAHHSRPHD